MSTMPSGPLGKLALALSGGGYRAAAFHLGLLDTLSAVGLLDEVVALSTVSGGTILGAAYSLARARGQAFPAFYREFYERLHERPLEHALQL
jgi:predicted acylesterase/phospholipase RssA